MKPNRLAREKSPYLLQHANNPVDWYPWGAEAFEKAAKEDKPIFLSIGYSTCHWCHVMEHESFENVSTADLLNRHFVAIKVDREERPDIDAVYMQYVMAATGSGGWPMSVFLTPERKPFYGGTYFPPEDRWGMPGFRTLLASIAGSWKDRRQEILDSAHSAVNFLAAKPSAGEGTIPGREILTKAAERMKASFDETYGGFGRAPKFPRSHGLTFLLRHAVRSGDGESLRVVEKTLEAMADGGLFDHLGGGFHRYSTDALWRIPHFEKMLYDQALLAMTYTEAFLATGKASYERTARRTLDYVLERMTSQEGGFTSAEDADSADPKDPSKKSEGAYYLWEKSEVESLLGPDAAAFIEAFGIRDEGNAISDPHGEFKGKNVLYRAGEAADGAFQASMTKLSRARTARPAPHLDDKVLTDWNALMIRAFAEASVALGEEKYLKAALRAAAHLESRLSRPADRWLHRYRDGEAAIDGSLNDYAFLIGAFNALYDATFDPHWLGRARGSADAMIEFFEDKDAGGFFLTASDSEQLISRPKEFYDGALVSGNSAAAEALTRLGRLTGEERYIVAAERTFAAFAGPLGEDPSNAPVMLMALDERIGPSSEVVIVVSKEGAQGAFLEEARRRYDPWQIRLVRAESDSRSDVLAAWTAGKTALGKDAAVYVCRDRACRLPATDLEALKKELDLTTQNKG